MWIHRAKGVFPHRSGLGAPRSSRNDSALLMPGVTHAHPKPTPEFLKKVKAGLGFRARERRLTCPHMVVDSLNFALRIRTPTF